MYTIHAASLFFGGAFRGKSTHCIYEPHNIKLLWNNFESSENNTEFFGRLLTLGEFFDSRSLNVLKNLNTLNISSDLGPSTVPN